MIKMFKMLHQDENLPTFLRIYEHNTNNTNTIKIPCSIDVTGRSNIFVYVYGSLCFRNVNNHIKRV